MSFRKLLLTLSALILPFILFAADIEFNGGEGIVKIQTLSVTNSMTITNGNFNVLRPVTIQFSIPANGTNDSTNTFSVKHVRVNRYSQFSTNSTIAPTNTVYLRSTNYWLLVDGERGVTANSITITNDQSVTLGIFGEPYIGFFDELTFTHSNTNVIRTHVITKEL